MSLAFLLAPFVYIAFCSAMSSVLPPVDYKAVSQSTAEQTVATSEDKQ